jgi:catechol 2,3-dioxygenase-like lactoylglutathione lyase family enzyme
MNLRLIEINHVALYISDLERSDHFYGVILKMPRLSRPEFDFMGTWYAIGNQELHLIADDNLKRINRNNHHFAIRVEDVFKIREALLKKGFDKMQEPKQRPDGAMQLFITDPDNYVIEFFSK